ncbi:DNA-3-methyladenine glycosylase 2 family protein [Candidatus Parcubacteria bacterium]|nr:MAG: DNA-3-methyladenine glycosylase 2 family protein [Candidatus Parcubacteria bacterium]
MTPAKYLASRDKRLGTLIKKQKINIPKPYRNFFQFLVAAIINQQLSSKAAATIVKRFEALFPGKKFPTPKTVLKMPTRKLRSCGMSGSKVEFIKDVARHFDKGFINVKKLRHWSDEEVVEHLVRIHGVGRWTAEMFLMFALSRPDVFSPGDLGLRRAIQRLYKMKKEPAPKQLKEISEKWKPYRTLASLYLWHSVDAKGGKI